MKNTQPKSLQNQTEKLLHQKNGTSSHDLLAAHLELLRRHRGQDHQQAIEHSRQAVTLLDEDVPPRLAAETLTEACEVHMSVGNIDEGLGYGSRAMEIAGSYGFDDLRSSVLTWMAIHMLNSCRGAEGVTYAREAAVAVENSPDHARLHATALETLARTLAAAGELEEAANAAHRSLQVLRGFTLDSWTIHAICNVHMTLSEILHESGDFAAALAELEHACELASHPEASLAVRFNCVSELGQLYLDEGEPMRALEYFGQAFDLARELQTRTAYRIVHQLLYLAHKMAGHHAEALEQYEKYVEFDRDTLNSQSEARLRQLQVEFALDHSQRKAEIAHLRAEQLQRQLDHQRAELAAQAIQIARQSESLRRFRNELRAILRHSDKAERAIVAVKEKLKELPYEAIDWTKFEAEFQQSYPDFKQKLLATYPELTKMEVKICSMLKLRLTSADIAALFCLSERSVEAHRYNIRRKLELKRGQDLREILDTI